MAQKGKKPVQFEKETGLSVWAQEHGTTVQEIGILVMSECPDTWEEVLSPSLTDKTPVPTGRSTALAGMLERGRAGDIRAKLPAVCYAMGCTLETITAILNARADAYDQVLQRTNPDAGLTNEDTIHSNFLQPLMADIIAWRETPGQLSTHANILLGVEPPPESPTQTGPADNTSDNTETPGVEDGVSHQESDSETPNPTCEQTNSNNPSEPDGTDPQSESRDPESQEPDNGPDSQAARRAARPKRKKTKYSIGKQEIADMLTGDKNDNRSIRDIRAFLLSLPDVKPVDIAMMSDIDAVEKFKTGYQAIPLGDGSLILSSSGYSQLIDTLGSMETYYIPNEPASQDD